MPLNKQGAEPISQLFHLGHRVIATIGEAAEFVRSSDLLMRSAKSVAKYENDLLLGLGKSWNVSTRMNGLIEDGGASRIRRKDDRVPIVVGVETQMVDEETAGFAVPATILNEPERAQTNLVALRQLFGLELTDAFVHCFASFVDHPRHIVRRDETIGWITWFSADPLEKRSPLWIAP